MQVFSSLVEDSKYNLIFIHGWGGNQHSLESIKRQFETKYNCFLLCLSGFGSFPLEKCYKIGDYLEEIEDFIFSNNLKSIVLIGHSFGGKLSLMLKRRHPKFIVIALAPSIVKNPFSLKVYLKVKLYKLLKKCHMRIPNFLLGSNDYRKAQGYLKETFLSVCHAYLNKKEVKELDACLIVAFENDHEVKYSSLKKIAKINKKITLVTLPGNHFAYRETLLDLYHIINGFLKEQR